jgi:hypothetical protein
VIITAFITGRTALVIMMIIISSSTIGIIFIGIVIGIVANA